MVPTFNVLDNAWIPVIYMDGKKDMVGVRAAMQKAPDIREISIAIPTEEFAVYRFLSVLLMDALRPETYSDIQSITSNGTFDMAKIEKYFALCNCVGLTFDVFNKSRPFMQPPYNKNWDKAPESITRLDFAFPSGNNHVHFEHRDASTVSYSYGEAFRKLLAYQLFTPQGGAGYSPSINGAPPFYVVINGENLFQTLCMMLVPLEKYLYVESQPGIGRMDDIEPRKVRGVVDPETSVEDHVHFFQAMFFPTRRIRLVPDEFSGSVSKVYFGPGYKYGGGLQWADPNVCYTWGPPDKENNRRRFTLKPNLDVPIWQNYTELIREDGRPTILSQYMEHNPNWSTASVTLYGMQTDQAKCCNYLRRDLTIPRLILENEEKATVVQDCLAYCENAKWRLEKALRVALQSEAPDASPSATKKANSAVKAGINIFLGRCEPAFLTMIDQVGLSAIAEQENILNQWKKDVFKIAKDVFNTASGSIYASGRVLRRIAAGQKILYGQNRPVKEE